MPENHNVKINYWTQYYLNLDDILGFISLTNDMNLDGYSIHEVYDRFLEYHHVIHREHPNRYVVITREKFAREFYKYSDYESTRKYVNGHRCRVLTHKKHVV